MCVCMCVYVLNIYVTVRIEGNVLKHLIKQAIAFTWTNNDSV